LNYNGIMNMFPKTETANTNAVDLFLGTDKRKYNAGIDWINYKAVLISNEKYNFVGCIGSCIDVTYKEKGEFLKDQVEKDLIYQN